MPRMVTALLALVLAGVGTLLIASPAQAASCIQIKLVYYNSPGSDTGSNSSLNAEYVRLENVCSSSRSLSGWTLRDRTGYTYDKFGTFRLGAGKTVTIHTGKGSNTASHRYWGRSWYVWNNTGDKAYLRDSAGTLKDTCEWGSSGSYKYC